MIRPIVHISLGFLFLFSCKSATEEFSELSPLKLSLTQKIEGTISIGGAYALYPLVRVWADSFMAIHRGVTISIYKDGTAEGLSGLKNGKYDLAMVSKIRDESDTTGEIGYIFVSQDAVIPIANSKNPYLQEIEEKGLTPQQLQELFISGERITWGKLLNKEYRNDAVVFTRYDGSGAADVWAGLFWKKQEDLKGSPVIGEDEMIKKVQSTPMGIGYSNMVNAFDPTSKKLLENISVIPIDLEFDRVVDFKEFKNAGLDAFHRYVWLGKYPKTLCRKLSIAVNVNSLNPRLNSFLVFILTSGQKVVKPTGFYPLNKVQIRNSYEELELINRTLTERNSGSKSSK